MAVNTIILGRRNLIPKKHLKAVKEKYEWHHYIDEKKCDSCDVADVRPDNCASCANYGGFYKLWARDEKFPDHIAIPYGTYRLCQKLAKSEGYEIIDKRKSHPFTSKIKWTGKLRTKEDNLEDPTKADQVTPAKTWFESGGVGLIKARPRTGKTVIAVRILVKLGEKTIILAKQEEFLKQFRWTMVGKPGAQAKPAMTNVPDIATTSNPVVMITNNVAKAIKCKADVILMTYQSLMHNEKKIALLNKYCNTLIVDECHGVGADGFGRVVHYLRMKYRLGLTATVKRKDRMERIVEATLGPVLAESHTSALVPHIVPYRVQAKSSDYKTWHGLMGFIANSKDRNKEIVRQVFADMRAGHSVIILPVDRVKHINTLVKMINNQALINNEKRNEKWPERLAVPFHRQTPREKTLAFVDRGKPCVLVANRSMIKEGVDFQRPSMLYILIPMSARGGVGAPMFQQLSNRVCTPFKKPTPVVKVFLDDCTISQRCFTGLLWAEIMPNKVGKNPNGMYHVSEEFVNAIKNTSVRSKRKLRSGPIGWN